MDVLKPFNINASDAFAYGFADNAYDCFDCAPVFCPFLYLRDRPGLDIDGEVLEHELTCARTIQFHSPPTIPVATPSPAYVLPLFRRPLGIASGRGGPAGVGIGSQTKSSD